MQNINISLPDPLKQFVDGQILSGLYSDPSEYFCKLIIADEKTKAEKWLEEQLLAGINSPESEVTAASWDEIRTEALAALSARNVKH